MFLQILNLLRADGSIVVNKTLAKNVGLHEAIIYSELVTKFIYYLENDMLTEDGYFYCTIEDLEEDTTLSRKQQDKAIDNLVKLGLIKKKIMKKDKAPKRFFTLNTDVNVILPYLSEKANEKLKNLINTGFVQKGQIEMSKRDKSKCPKGTTNNTNINNTKLITTTTDLDSNQNHDTMATEETSEQKDVVVVDKPNEIVSKKPKPATRETIKDIQEQARAEGVNLTQKNIRELWKIADGDIEQVTNGILAAVQYAQKTEVRDMWGLIRRAVADGRMPALVPSALNAKAEELARKKEKYRDVYVS